MKKYYNKALFYQSFYNSKWGILGGAILLFLVTYYNGKQAFRDTAHRISIFNDNNLYLENFTLILFMFLSILIVYIMIIGFNKRNNITFIMSGPYTREEIKKNEFLFLFSTLCLFTLVIAYVNMCLYIKNSELLFFIYNPWSIFIATLIKVFTLGLTFIVYLSFMDMFFSNLIVTLIAIIGFPISILLNLSILRRIYFYNINSYEEIISTKIYNIIDSIFSYINDIIDFIFNSFFFYNELWKFYTIVCTFLIISILIYYISKFINKKITINNINKFFIVPLVGKITVFTVVFSALLLVSYYVIFSIGFSYILLNMNNFKYTLYLTVVLVLLILVAIALTKVAVKKINKYI